MNTLLKQFPIKKINIKTVLKTGIISLSFLPFMGCAMIGLDMGSDRSTLDRSPAGWTSEMPTSNSEDARNELNRRRRLAIMNQDILLGMTTQDVQSAWGTPRDIETAGISGSGNERWVYYNGNSMNYGMEHPRVVYFEQGRVVGWESANR